LASRERGKDNVSFNVEHRRNLRKARGEGTAKKGKCRFVTLNYVSLEKRVWTEKTRATGDEEKRVDM